MSAVYWSWAISAGVLVLLAAALGGRIRGNALGILIDTRGRCSLSHLQVVLWSLVVLSLVSGIFFGRLASGVDNSLNFALPSVVLGVLGISVGSTVTSNVIKSAKDTARPEAIAASDRTRDPAFFGQVFTVEEGPLADKIVDVAKFQNFVITVLLVVAYVALAISMLRNLDGPADITSLPVFPAAFLTLLGISHAGYLTGKMPAAGGTDVMGQRDMAGVPVVRRAPGLTVADLGNPDVVVDSPRRQAARQPVRDPVQVPPNPPA